MVQFMIEIPYVFVQSLVYGLIVYSMMSFDWTAEKFFWFLFFFFFSLLYFVLYGMMTVAVTPNHNVAAIISSFFYGIWNLFSGFVVPRPVSSHTSIYFYTNKPPLCIIVLIKNYSLSLNRKSRFGGGGTTGPLPCHTPCTA